MEMEMIQKLARHFNLNFVASGIKFFFPVDLEN